jgi:hypothetical protein
MTGEEQLMRQVKRFASAASAAVVAASVVAVTPAAAESGGGAFLPFASVLRRCDHSAETYYPSHGDGRATAQVRTDGGQVVADVQLVTAEPGSYYKVRLIQMPRESWGGCDVGAPGTAVSAINTDGVGAGAVTLRSPRMPGATGAWVAVERPQPNSQQPAEFYTSDFVAAL